MEWFAAPALTPPALLPAELSQARATTRPIRTAGSQPRAAVVLVTVDVQGLAS